MNNVYSLYQIPLSSLCKKKRDTTKTKQKKSTSPTKRHYEAQMHGKTTKEAVASKKKHEEKTKCQQEHEEKTKCQQENSFRCPKRNVTRRNSSIY